MLIIPNLIKDDNAPSGAQVSDIAVRHRTSAVSSHPPPSPMAFVRLPDEDLSEDKEPQLVKSPNRINPSFQLFLTDPSHLSLIVGGLHGLTDWQGFGLVLGLEYADLESIHEKTDCNVDKCKTAVIEQWLLSGTATKTTFMAALRVLGKSSTTNARQEK